MKISIEWNVSRLCPEVRERKFTFISSRERRNDVPGVFKNCSLGFFTTGVEVLFVCFSFNAILFLDPFAAFSIKRVVDRHGVVFFRNFEFFYFFFLK